MPDPPVLQLTLRDGRPVALRPIETADRGRLSEGFEALSPASRRLRFLGAVSRLSDTHLSYLTEVDGTDHVAWVALDLADRAAPGFGVGRFIRLDEGDGTIAEFSLTVLDCAQGHGVGQLLLATLAVVAPRVGVETLRGVVAPENDKMLRWLRRLGAVATETGEDVVLDLALPVEPSVSTSAAEFADTTDQIRVAMAQPGVPGSA